MYYIKNLEKHIIKLTYFEGHYFYLIDNTTGKIDTLDNEPIIINKNILTIYQDMEDADEFSTIKFYCINNNRLELIKMEKKKWIAGKINVTKDNKILVEGIATNSQQKYFMLITL